MNANYMLNTTLSAWDIIVNKERYIGSLVGVTV